jgi:hypothetical protein
MKSSKPPERYNPFPNFLLYIQLWYAWRAPAFWVVLNLTSRVIFSWSTGEWRNWVRYPGKPVKGIDKKGLLPVLIYC